MKHLVSRIGGLTALLAAPLLTTAAPAIGIDTAARYAMKATGARGLAIATVDHGQVSYVAAYGDRDATGNPLTVDTVMYGASLTKAVVGYLTTQLASEGVLDLDQPIARLLPQPLPSYGNVDGYGHWGDLAGDERWRAITPRMVLNHSTGFANFAFLEPDHHLHIHFAPGSRYSYSGEGMMLLQFGLERGAGIDLEGELQKRFFLPFGMMRTSLRWQDRFDSNVADGWDDQGKPQRHDRRSHVRAAGSMDTTISDLAKMVAAMMRGDGVSASARTTFAKGTLAITSGQQFPTLQSDVPRDGRPAAKAALGVIAFEGPQGRGWYKGGHDDITANTLVCLEQGMRCVLILSNDVRAEKSFPTLVRAALGETDVPFRWEYPGLPGY